ncbi:MAG: glutamine--fructose-6-phosphate transaminase (isomerizing) [Thermoleophilia bacterium]|nr:glutamine--fructose-6-phosphate transaminase (isomerizing) [Thermoleophilia bacterium]
MCGIIAYAGHRSCANLLYEGLRKLEYRGYDSAGLSVLSGGEIKVIRAVGNLDSLQRELRDNGCSDGRTGLGHTRWATHGRPSTENAHPHTDCTGSVSIVLNGIVENYMELKEELTGAGHVFASQTDAEVVAHLVEKHYQGDLLKAVRLSIGDIKGHFAICAMHSAHPRLVVGARKECPLLVGLGKGETFIASAIPAFLSETRDVKIIEDDELAVVTPAGVEILDLDLRPQDREITRINWDADAAEKGGFESFMRKEIYEQPGALSDTLAGRLAEDGRVVIEEMAITGKELAGIDNVYIVACGTSYHAGLVGRYFLEKWARVAVALDVASEFRYRDPVLSPSTLVVGISQSGETADTLVALKQARALGARTVAITNIMGSQITRDAEGVLYTRAGLEIGVAATKTHIAQIAALQLLALYLAQLKQTMSPKEIAGIAQEMAAIPDLMRSYLKNESVTHEIAKRYYKKPFFLYLGRGVGLPVCLEGALKLKEISYIPTEAYAAGEMKHGPIALLDKGSPVVVVATDGHVYEKVVSNIEEVRARDAAVIAVVSEGNESVRHLSEDVMCVPRTSEMLSPLLSVVPLQLLAYHIAQLKGCNVDQPRNLAKTVTVE